MRRIVEPELLDSLPADDSRAIRSRRDLARINVVMGQAGLMAARLKTLPQPKVLIDLGGGDGKFLLQVARRLQWVGVHALIADRQDIVSGKTKAAFQALQWTCETLQGDIFSTLESHDAEAGSVYITANLFLHHFEEEALTRLLALAARRADLFVALEPRRSIFALTGARLVWFIGANSVTRHDAVASVRAGFCGAELTTLWPHGGWTLDEGKRFPFSHCFVALKS